MAVSINWSDLNSPLQEQDVIQVSEAEGAPDEIHFVLKVSRSIRRWKGLKLFFRDGRLWDAIGIKDQRYEARSPWTLAEFPDDRIIIRADEGLLRGARLELCKAKFFEGYTSVYSLEHLLAKRGKIVIFMWRQD